MTTPVFSVDATGAHVPDFETIRAWLAAQYRGIYGQDIVLENSTQDGQWLAIIAGAINDANSAALAAYDSFRPDASDGVALDTLVKINGIKRKVASYSTSDVVVTGQDGAVITNGIVSDGTSQWALPASVTIPASGETTVTATCTRLGAIAAAAGTITRISTPTAGWQSVTNPADATPGSPVETDPELKARQAISTAIPSLSIMDGLQGAIASLPGVTAMRAYENDTDGVDANGLPAHSVAMVIDGGIAQSIADTIRLKKGSGVATFGTTSEVSVNSAGVAQTIHFSRPASVPITYYVRVKAKTGFTLDTQNAIADALAVWTNALGIGEGLALPQAYMPAQLFGSSDAKRFELLRLHVARDGGLGSASDIAVTFNERPYCQRDYVSFEVMT